MTAHYKTLLTQKIRIGHWLTLIFFVHTITGCRPQAPDYPALVWSGKQATGIVLPHSVLKDRDVHDLQVMLEKSGRPMLGDWEPSEEGFTFRPPLALLPGRRYEVFYDRQRIASLTVPPADPADSPELLAVYPSADTLPENLLKVYLVFSSPMREGEALRHIHLLNEKGDTLPGTFLDLQPELWNPERTALTVWLDPGRIKRGLIPNERLGNPLKKGARYQLAIAGDWTNGAGLKLRKSFLKNFLVAPRDDSMRAPSSWTIGLPASGTTHPLQVGFGESLDHFLALETIRVLTAEGVEVKGSITLVDGEKGMIFRPATPWRTGSYRLRVASYLEDVAGNNLNRPFDRDIRTQQQRNEPYRERIFAIGDGSGVDGR